jgi:hypothetical protein
MALQGKVIPASWRQYRRRNLIATFSLVVGIPCVVTLAILFKLWNPKQAHIAFPVLLVMWALFWGWSAFRVARWPCPRCGRPWLSYQEPHLGAERRCKQCGLGLYEAPEPVNRADLTGRAIGPRGT